MVAIRLRNLRAPLASKHAAFGYNPPWLEKLKSKVRKASDRKPPAEPTIFRVPPIVRSSNWFAYAPTRISIGPYHRGATEETEAMEELKCRLLQHYLSKVRDESKDKGLRKIKEELEKRARECYSEVIDLNSDDFTEMLLLDGCFLILIFISVWDANLGAEELRSLLFGNTWFRNVIFQDLLQLENQLPYFILQHLLEMLEIPWWTNGRLQDAAIKLFSLVLSPYVEVPWQELPDRGIKVDHLLHLFHTWISRIPESHKGSGGKLSLEPLYSALSQIIDMTGYCLSKVLPCCRGKKFPHRTIPSATELAEAGVNVEVRKEAKSFLDISFCNGVLGIPAINIDDRTNFVFANLIALEKCCHKHGSKIAQYTKFMDQIINTPRDVELLHQEGVIGRCLGDDKDVATLFNKLGEVVDFEPDSGYLESVYRHLNDYCQTRWHRWRAKAVRDYFSNPWAIISLGAAILLLGLTILQSVYSILDYSKS